MAASLPPSSASTSEASAVPASESVQFARGILLRFSLWPTMKTAVAEQWGGPDSASKRDFLVGHLVDEYGMPAASTSAPGSASSSAGAQRQQQLPSEIDVDDLHDIIQDYVEEEYECRIEDDSVYPVARDLVALHRAIFVTSTQDGGAAATQLLQELEDAASRLRGVKVEVQRQSDVPDDDDDDAEDDGEDGEDGDEEDGDGDAAMEDAPQAASRPRPPPREPEVDEDGFTTVQSGRRRRA